MSRIFDNLFIEGHAGFGVVPSASYRVDIDATSATFNGLLVTNDFDRAIVGQVVTNSGLIAVQGIANTGGAGVGIQGLTSNGYGAYGSATTGTAVYGFCSNPSGGAIAGLFECPDGSGGGGSIIKGLGNGAAERFRVAENGNWGIGIVPTSDTKVYVKGVDTTSGTYALKAESSTANIIAVRDDHTLIFQGISTGFTGSQKFEKQDGTQTGTKADPLTKTISTISTSSNQMIIVKGTAAGFQNDFSNSYGSTFFAVFKNSGGTLTQVSTTDLSEKYTFGSTPTTTVTTDGGTNIIIQVTGVTSVLINWVVSYEYTTLSSNI